MNKNISPQMSNCRSLEQKLFFEHEKEYDMTYGNSVSYLLRNSYKSRMNNVFINKEQRLRNFFFIYISCQLLLEMYFDVAVRLK